MTADGLDAPVGNFDPPTQLTPQQKTALWLYASDLTIEDVASLMGIARSTVKDHLRRAYKNLGTGSTRHGIRAAYELGIFVPRHLNGALEKIEALEQQVQQQQEVILRASEGVEDKVVAPETAVTAIQTVAMQLSTMAHVTPGAGLAATLRTMSNNLDRALRELGATTVESPLDGATRALENVGLRGVNRIFIGVVLEDHPEIKHLADEWDWSDTEVRDKIAEHVVCDMLGLSSTQYEQAIHDDGSREALMKRFWDSHEKWT